MIKHLLIALVASPFASAQAIHPSHSSKTPDSEPAQQVAPAQSQTQLLEVDGVLIELKTDALAGTRYRIALDGHHYARERTARYTLHLQSGNFDPLLRQPKFEGALAKSGNLHIVQFETQSLQVYRDALEQAGATVRSPLNYQAHLVEMDAKTVSKIKALPFVRWVGPYSAAHRIEPAILDSAEGMPKNQRYNVQVFERGLAQKEQVAARLAHMGGQVDHMIPEGFLIEVRMSPELLQEVASWDQVLWIDRLGEFEEDMDNVRIDGGANYLESNTGFTGQGVRAEVMDGNLEVSHQDLQSNPAILHTNNAGSGSHGTNTTGIVFGDGTGSSSARGMLPDGQPIFADYSQYGGNRYAHTAELLQAPYEAVFQTNSWGSSRTTVYNSVSMEMDDILFENDIVILQSQSNAGNQDSRPQAWAKNIVAVGGIRHQGTLSLSDDAWSGAGSIGPAQDGRIKPDISYWYDNIRTTTTGNSYTNTFGGTSAATPMSAGLFGLFYQMWHTGMFGNTPAATVFESRPKATTVRAMMINSARSYDFTGSTSDLTRSHQGWGRVNVQDIHDNASDFFIVNEEDVLANLESATYSVTVPANTDDLRVTMAYLDPAGTTSSSMHRINDLTLRVTSPGGATSYWGNNGLNTGNWSTSGGSSNDLDVIENVFVQNPTAGTWQIEVFADELVEDAHTETAAIDADFALVVRGVSGASSTEISDYCFPTVPNSTGLPTILSADFSAPTGTGLHLDVTLGPPAHIGYFLVGSGMQDPGTPLGSGHFCLATTGSHVFGRYNIAGGVHNSIGLFDGSGHLQNLAGTSYTGFGFDVPTDLPTIGGVITSGSTWHFQLWHRDASGTSNLSSAVQVSF